MKRSEGQAEDLLKEASVDSLEPLVRVRLGVNIDHVATLRQARGTRYPEPLQAAALAELAGADQITIHLREDRRHIQDRDLTLLRQTIQTRLNLEMAATEEMLAIAVAQHPNEVTLVPERRQELTTEGGLEVAAGGETLERTIGRLQGEGIMVSLFIDPDLQQIEAAVGLGVEAVELHTGRFCDATTSEGSARELDRVAQAAQFAAEGGLMVAAGHGLNYTNVEAIVLLPEIEELNIGHSLVARALFVGFEEAVRQMRDLILR